MPQPKNTQGDQPAQSDQAQVVENKDAARQVRPSSERPKDELKAAVVNKDDLERGVLSEPEHAADQTSVPGPEYPPADRPPVATTRFDEPVIQSLVLGAGEHQPPDPAKYTPEGRLRDDQTQQG